MEEVINGSDLLLKVAGKCIGHCTSHTITISPEVKERIFKPKESKVQTKGKFKNRTVTGMDVSISFEGMVFVNEEEMGYDELLALTMGGEPVEVESFRRKVQADETPEPFIKGNFVLSNLVLTAPAGDDTTCSGELQNDGDVATKKGILTPANLNQVINNE